MIQHARTTARSLSRPGIDFQSRDSNGAVAGREKRFSPTPAAAMAMVRITRPLVKMTRTLNVVMVVRSYWFLASDVVANMPPSPMVSTAEEGTITIAPFSLIASYSMFMARKCSATGLSR